MYHCKWLEPRSISSLLSVIVWVGVVVKRAVVVEIE